MATIPAYHRSIEYDRETSDFAMYLDGELVGFAPTRAEAESRIDALVYDLLTRQDIAAKAAEQEAQAPEYDLEDEHAAPLPLDAFHWLLENNPAEAYADLAMLSESQLTRQAIAYAAAHGLDWQETLSDWQNALR